MGSNLTRHVSLVWGGLQDAGPTCCGFRWVGAVTPTGGCGGLNKNLVVFVKAMKAVALAAGVLALGGCAVGVGLIFASLLTALSYSPDSEDTLFGYSMIGFALVETFAVLALGVLGLVYVL